MGARGKTGTMSAVGGASMPVSDLRHVLPGPIESALEDAVVPTELGGEVVGSDKSDDEPDEEERDESEARAARGGVESGSEETLGLTSLTGRSTSSATSGISTILGGVKVELRGRKVRITSDPR